MIVVQSETMKDKCNQTGVYWAFSSAGGYGGHTYTSADEISLRWSDKQELFTDPNGEQKLSAAVIHLNQDVTVGSYLYLGAESTLDSSHDNPEIISGAKRIVAFSKVPDVGGTDYTRKAWLI